MYLDVSAITAREELHAHIAQDYGFPDCYGSNWDAFDECIRDVLPHFDFLRMKPMVARITIIISWVLIAWGTLGLGFSIAMAYMLFSGQVKPGEPYYVDDLAPTYAQAAIQLSVFGGMLVFGFVAKTLARRRLLVN